MIELNEQERIAAYQRGWNDAQYGRAARPMQPIMYQIGYIESMKGVTKRFQSYGCEVH